MKRFTIFACAALGLLINPASADQCPPLHLVASVALIVDHGRALVPVTVGDEQLYFTVSTAMPYSAVSQNVVAAHNYPRLHSAVKFVGLSGEVSDKITTVPSFAMGRLRSEKFDLLVTDMHEDRQPPGAKIASGVLGADILRGYDVELDFGAGKLNLISRDRCDAMPVYWPSETIAKLPMVVTDTSRIVFTMTLDGHDLQTVLNTGLSGSTIKESVAHHVYDIDSGSPGNVPAGKLGDGTALFAHRFQSMGFEGLTISNPLLLVLPSRADEKIEHLRAVSGGMGRAPLYLKQQPDLTLGLAELKQMHVYIDYHHQMVYFTPATTAQPAAKPTTP